MSWRRSCGPLRVSGGRNGRTARRAKQSVRRNRRAQASFISGPAGCRVCSVCAKVTGEPCRHPDMAMRSLETYGINVSLLAQEAGMRYINGQNTVTYFGAVFMRGGRPQEPEKERR